MSPSQRQWWEWKRQQGFWRFVMYDGVLGWGTTTAALVLLFNEWFGYVDMIGHPVTRTVIIGMVVGGLWGAAMWGVHERTVENATASARKE